MKDFPMDHNLWSDIRCANKDQDFKEVLAQCDFDRITLTAEYHGKIVPYLGPNSPNEIQITIPLKKRTI